MAEHRVSMLSASLRRYEDPANSADPRIRQLVADLRTLEPAPAPRAHFQAELRAQLVAVAPRLVAEGTHAAPIRTRRRPATGAAHAGQRTLSSVIGSAAERLRTVSIGRPIAIVTSVVAILALLLGGAVFVSKKALPGDALYGLKRANENVQLSLTSGGTARAKQYLSFASTRADEVSDLLHRSSASAAGSGPSAAGGVNSHTSKLIASTLNSADSDVRNAAQLLGGEAVRNGSAEPLTTMTDWAPGQLDKLQAITDRLPAGDLHDAAAESAQLVSDALTRAKDLQAMVDCDCLGSAATDELGPIPCPICDLPLPQPTSPEQGTTGPSVSDPSGTSKATKTPPPAGGTTGGNTGGAGSTLPVGIPGVTGSDGGVTVPSLPLPSVTISVPNLLSPTGGATSSSAAGGSTPTPTCLLSLLGICVQFG